MHKSKYFLSDIFMAESPVQIKLIDLETGDSFNKKITDLCHEKGLLSELNALDTYKLGYLLAMELGGKV